MEVDFLQTYFLIESLGSDLSGISIGNVWRVFVLNVCGILL